MALGQISAQSFALPDVRIGGQPQQVDPNMVAQVEQLLPAAEQELDAANGLRNNYFNQYRQLKDFATSMAKRGIDVTRPDYSEPDGGTMYQSYLAMEGALRGAAQDLAQSKKIKDKRLEGQFQGEFVPAGEDEGGVATTIGGYNPKFLPQDVQRVIEMRKSKVHTSGDKTAIETATAQTIQNYTDAYKAETDPAKKAQLKEWVNAMALQTPMTTSDAELYARFREKADGDLDGEALNLAGTFLNALEGGTEGAPVVTKDGEAALSFPVVGGLSFGQTTGQKDDGTVVTVNKIIKDFIKTPDGKMYFVYGAGIPDERVDDKPKGVLIQQLIAHNKGGTKATQNTLEAVLKFLNKGGTDFDAKGFFGEEESKRIETTRETNKTALNQFEEQLKKDKQQLDTVLEKTSTPYFYGKNDNVMYATKNGTRVEIQYEASSKDKLYVPNFSELGLDKKGPHTREAVKAALLRSGYSDFSANKYEENQSPQAFDPTQF